ncbi:P-loop containing nucleoside triphosphate hydrolase protein [Coniophora puteana RWD-64-598 SS2]|uniref:P-loop containing nucleoside triphosphate hydrolase protein n=1 Tax=Coniophora puteana (strain RWD-64-598) TaxID=741705 RepID=A0A5M3MPQ8_CONPW|nr:P-loop containing nucleoside triphosphate hydrolase protein [Coniophora puteana RWD-64-598 SS2]EIW80551.1 P-loop containing nucleoside triphosphate hydrolase protein [Coniophora puteana RWD-64-598 SS2]
MNSKSWYAERGIPFRRGYLLYGAPGAGKTSLIHSIAGELNLDVYILSLSRSGLDDSSLSQVISELPEKCIALMEDIDAAFHHGLTREGPSPADDAEDGPDGPRKPRAAAPSGKVSLSGLLNALDGIGAQEGRILFATTNKYTALDPALCRPGRMDLHIEFRNASRYQAEELFKRFYLPSGSLSDRPLEAAGAPAAKPYRDDDQESTDSGYGGSRAESEKLIDVDESSAPSPSRRSSSPEKPSFVGVSHSQRAPRMSPERFRELATRFADAIPERKLSMAALQGYLMTYKIRPVQAVEDVAAWVERELAQKDAAEDDP